ncbi:ERF family protein [Microbispora sp. CSR-4]|uniref:ERF family protein n=1 Tax=Microbispora sp. CSR-4 TaxID=2592813 RepID=UPI0034DB505B
METNNVYIKLVNIQSTLKAPKSQFNSFGKYNYRSCEDILEGLKPILKEEKALVILDDKVFKLFISFPGNSIVNSIATSLPLPDPFPACAGDEVPLQDRGA